MAPINAESLSNLGCQFPGRGEHECPDGAPRARLFTGEVMENRESKSCRFSRTGLCDAHDVAARHEGWNRFGLNRRRGLVTFGIQRFQNSFIKFQIAEG